MAAHQITSAKEAILKKIREGLAQEDLPMPFPEAEGKPLTTIFAYHGLSLEETFAEEFIKLGGKFVYCADEQEAMSRLIALHDSKDWPQLLCADAQWMQRFQEARMDFISPAPPHIENANACITTCAYLVARTGSVIFSSKAESGRTAPVFYPVHIILAYASQLVEDLSPALEALVQQGSLPSMINLNTGPSRTADIEKTLVVGVHGPAEVYCFFIHK